jgi:predicted ArsR family transcriptional regulator
VAGDEIESRLSRAGALVEPARRALYLYVFGAEDGVSRDEAAENLGLPHHTVKFHLDRLVKEGLLDVEYRRLTGRTGPGAGRTAKLYRPSAEQVAVSLPERRYDMLGSLLARAVDAAVRGDAPIEKAVRDAAEAEGIRIGAEVGPEGSPEEGCLGRVSTVLAGYGFDPQTEGDTVSLANCPFHQLSSEHTELVCGMNLSLISALVRALGCQDLDVELRPAPGRCCVLIHSDAALGRREHGREALDE